MPHPHILVVFEKAGATTSNHNVKIEFDFDAKREPLRFDLNHFRESEAVIREVESRFLNDDESTVYAHSFNLTRLEERPLEQYFQDILQLPIWKARHELYSVWIFSEIIRAFPYDDIEFIVKDNQIVFSWEGAHLTTIKTHIGKLELWCELGSKLANPVGKGRKGHIKPDYTLTLDVDNPLKSVLVVECKQYIKPSSRSFSAALTDYSRGRENANVILVDYGSVRAKTILHYVPCDLHNRVHIIGNLVPSSGVQNEFYEYIEQTVEKYLSLK